MTHSFWIDIDEHEGQPIDSKTLEDAIYTMIMDDFQPVNVDIDYMAEGEVTIGNRDTSDSDSADAH